MTQYARDRLDFWAWVVPVNAKNYGNGTDNAIIQSRVHDMVSVIRDYIDGIIDKEELLKRVDIEKTEAVQAITIQIDNLCELQKMLTECNKRINELDKMGELE